MAWSDNLARGTPAYLIASSPNERIRVVAGPGTGKSFAMKRRVARLLEEGIDPRTILPVTFTRVAAEDLHRELIGMRVPGCDDLNGVTLHSLALKMLMRNHVLNVTGRTARPLNEFEIEPLICDLMRVHGGKREIGRRKQAYEAAWARLQHEQPGFIENPDDVRFAGDLLSWLRFHQAMLIGEVIPLFYEYLRSNPRARERSEFSHILVDEYQDLNKAEQGVIEMLSQNADVCIVGDDDQSIYSFKHAHPEGIRDWMIANAGADDLRLDECHRCPTRIVGMANSLIQNNRLRVVPRVLVPHARNGPGDVRIIQYGHLASEVEGVATLISAMIADGTPPGDILVLAQRGAIGTPIYEALQQRRVAVRSYYAETELNNLETQRRFSLLKIFVDREDRVALRWLVGLNGNKWHEAGYRKIREYCERTGETPWQVFEQLSARRINISGTSRIVADFEHLVVELEDIDSMQNLGAVIDHLFPEGDDAFRDMRAIAVGLLDEIDEGDFDGLLSGLIEAISQPEIPTQIEDVRIMSLHKSKGLSSPVTFICGCVEGLLPKQPDVGIAAAEAAALIEEQRRLFFVGISRVKAVPSAGKPGTLVLTYSQQMPMASAMGSGIAPAAGRRGSAILHASRFIAELGAMAPIPVRG